MEGEILRDTVTPHRFRRGHSGPRSWIKEAPTCFKTLPAVLVPRRWRYEITERIDAQGNLVIPLEEADIDAVITGIQDVGLDTVAVSCLFSFLNDERALKPGTWPVWLGEAPTDVAQLAPSRGRGLKLHWVRAQRT